MAHEACQLWGPGIWTGILNVGCAEEGSQRAFSCETEEHVGGGDCYESAHCDWEGPGFVTTGQSCAVHSNTFT